MINIQNVTYFSIQFNDFIFQITKNNDKYVAQEQWKIGAAKA